MADAPSLEQCRELARQLRIDSVRAVHGAQSGHATSSLSAADLMAVLMARHLRYDFADPDNPANDHLIFSKGHASPLLYSMYKAAGAVTDEELLSFRSFGSRLEGHPTPVIPWVDVATGSLGQGLPIGVGIALAGRRLDDADYRVWVLCGDSEMAEGSIWEALSYAAFAGLDNLTLLIDVNRLGQRGETMFGWDLDVYARRLEAFGWHAVVIDGHDVDAIDAALMTAAATDGRPTAIVAKTKKGKGVSAVEDQEDAHGKPVPNVDAAIAELGGPGTAPVAVAVAKPEPDRVLTPLRRANGPVKLPRYEVGSSVATRKAYGEALAALGSSRRDVVALDGEVANSTYAEIFRDQHPDRYFEMYIAEQLLVAAAVGMQVRGWTPFTSTFAAFYARAYDFIRMAAVSRASIRLCGSHAGVSIGEDGPSQMGLEDLAALRAVHGSTVLYPCDGNQTAQLVALMADTPGISYVRTTRGNTPVIYDDGEEFTIGGSRVLRSAPDDTVTIVGAGITVHEALRASDALAAEGIAARVVDLYSVKPVDDATLRDAATSTGHLITVEDHWPEGGLGEAVLDSLARTGTPCRVTKLAVASMPGSGKPGELLRAAEIDAAAIVAACRRAASS